MEERYRDSKGVPVPGVTDIMDALAKPALVKWANKIGLDGYSLKEWVDPLGDVGTLAHKMIAADMAGFDADAYCTDAPRHIIDMAENSFLSYLEWRKGKYIEPIHTEKTIVSDTLRCGGRLDFLGYIDGLITVADYKTGNLYENHWYQVAAYGTLASVELNINIQQFMLLNIPRTEDEKFYVDIRYSVFNEWRIFNKLKEICEISGGNYGKRITPRN